MNTELTNFDEIDFNELYKKQKESTTFKPKTAKEWDKKAIPMNQRIHDSIYNEQFINLLDLNGVDTVLDMGCGVGNLSLKLAPKVEQIFAVDYSPKMLEFVEYNKQQLNIENIKTIEKSWTDSWEDIPSSDLVLASRSLEVEDMKEALIKLNEKAKKRVVVSFKVGGSFLSDEVLEVLQRDIVKKPDYIYLINILYQMGINAKVDFITSEGKQVKRDSFGDFVDSVTWSIGSLKADDIQNLVNYYNEVLSKKEPEEQEISWAIISWEKRD